MTERELFLSALDIENAEARLAHVEEGCGGDLELLDRVATLLASHDGESRFLRSPVVEQLAHESVDDTGATVAYDSKCDATRDSVADPTAHGSDDATDDDEDVFLGYLDPSPREDSLGRLAHYEILEVIGQGAFGTVLKAFDERLHRVVAIKVLSLELAATSPARKRFLREARSSAAVRHENVVGIYAVEDDPLPYLVMEYVPGTTLQQRLDEHGPLDVREVLRLGKQIADGLSAAHARELIHRDVKPGNILLETSIDDHVKLTDFGLARTADDASMTQSGLIAGTPMYMAPEQALGRPLDQRADLFSFGSVLYQMLSGRPPFRASSTLAVLKRVTEDAPRPIREVIPEVPEWMCELVGHLHAKNPEDRYGSAKAVADLLQRCLDDVQEGRTPRIPAPGETNDLPALRGATHAPTNTRHVLQRPLGRIAAAVLLLVVGLGLTEAAGVTHLAATVVRLTTGSGILVIESNDPDVGIAIDGTDVTIRGGGVEELTLRPGDYQVAALKDGQPVKRELVTITRNGRTVVRMSLEAEGTRTKGNGSKGNGSKGNGSKGNGGDPAGDRPAADPPVAETEWLSLFNGRDLTGWKTIPELPGQWEVKDGVLTGSARQGYLFTERGDFANFHLRVEARINGLGGGGIHFRAPFEFRHGPQAWMTQPASGYASDLFNQPIPVGTLWEIVKAAPPRVLCRAADNPALPAGAWFTLEVVADGNHFVTNVNGRPALDCLDPASRYAAGHLALSVADPSTVVEFRHIEIRELPASPPSQPETPRLRHFVSNEWIDVIPLIDPRLDKWDMRLTGTNDWRIEEGELVVGGTDDKPRKLLLPLDADFYPAFECELEVTRRKGDQGFNLNFPTSNGDTALNVDSAGGQGLFLRSARTGLTSIADGPLLETGKRIKLRVEVRRRQTGDGVIVWEDGTQVGTWTGNRNQLASINNEGYEHRRRLSLFVFGGENEFVFHRIRVRILDGGTADALRPVPANDARQ